MPYRNLGTLDSSLPIADAIDFYDMWIGRCIHYSILAAHTLHAFLILL